MASAESTEVEAPRAGSLRPDIALTTLENGLRIYTLEDHSAPLVTFEMWFQVGSGDELEGVGDAHGITGLSHFFEHMMFRGTPDHPQFFEEVYALGGKLNAWTWLDATCYWEKIPSNHLQRVIALEADRVRNMDMSFLSLEPEREVVKAERLLRTDNDPNGAMSELLDATAFRTHSYHWPTVGWMRDLNRITLEEARAYHHAHYAPNNAYLVVVGDFQTEEVVRWVRESFGDLEPRDVPRRSHGEEPVQTEERQDYMLLDVETPIARIGYRVPAFSDPDWPVLEVIDQILNGGKSSRLKQRLVFGPEPIVAGIESSLLPVRDPYLYFWGFRMLPGHALSEALSHLDEEMENIANEPVDPTEVARASARLQASVIRDMLTTQQRADLIGFGLRAADNPLLFFDRLASYGEISAADVQRVARRILGTSRRTRIHAVAPARIAEVLGSWAQSLPDATSALLRRANELALREFQFRKTEREIRLESEAIQELSERAELARIEFADDAEKLSALESYLVDNEKGLTVRTAALDAARTTRDEERSALDAERSALSNSRDSLADGSAESALFRYLVEQNGAELTTLAADSAGAPVAWIIAAIWADQAGESDLPARWRASARAALATESSPDPALKALLADTERIAVRSRTETLGGQFR